MFRLIRPKKISFFSGNGSENLGRVGTHIFLNYFIFLQKKIILCILKGISKCIKLYFISENLNMSQGDDGGGDSTNIVVISSLHLIKILKYTNYSPMLILPPLLSPSFDLSL